MSQFLLSRHRKHSATTQQEPLLPGRCKMIKGPIILGAKASGLAVAAGLKKKSIESIIIDPAESIAASQCENQTFDPLQLLPPAPFPENFPEHPSKPQYTTYLESYANQFQIKPRFGESVEQANFDETIGLWRVTSVIGDGSTTEYICTCVVVAGEENAEIVVPEFEGLSHFSGKVMHVSDYKSGEDYEGKRVLVVGCRNSGMEVSLDLCLHGAYPSMVVRSSVHVLPTKIMGQSTLEWGEWMARSMPIRAVDSLIVGAARLILGNVEKYGLKSPATGPLELKNREGKAPVFDKGALARIKTGEIKIVGGIKRFVQGGVELVNDDFLEIDSVILATGYCSNVPSWLKESGFPNGWRGEHGVYAVGFSRRGLTGASMDAVEVSEDMQKLESRDHQVQKRISLHMLAL